MSRWAGSGPATRRRTRGAARAGGGPAKDRRGGVGLGGRRGKEWPPEPPRLPRLSPPAGGGAGPGPRGGGSGSRGRRAPFVLRHAPSPFPCLRLPFPFGARRRGCALGDASPRLLSNNFVVPAPVVLDIHWSAAAAAAAAARARGRGRRIDGGRRRYCGSFVRSRWQRQHRRRRWLQRQRRRRARCIRGDE